MTAPVTRRAALALIGAAALPAQAQARADTLGAAAAAAGVVFGASITTDFESDPAYAALYLRECRMVTTDYELKLPMIRPEPSRVDYAKPDRIVAFAERNGLAIHGHTLIWNEDTPRWMRGMSGREIERLFDEHIEMTMSRYAGRIATWDVVNEPFWPDHGKVDGYRDGPWFAALGPSYVERAFRRAASVDPKARLVLNEAHCEIADGWGAQIRPRLIGLVERLQDAGVPLHAVGLQGHLQPQKPFDDAFFLRFVERIADRRVAIRITELDVNDEAFPFDIETRDAMVAERYGSFLSQVLREPAVEAVTTWNLADHYSWYRDRDRPWLTGGRRSRPLPFDRDLKPKPAHAAMLRAFRTRRAAMR